jgi:hypothetical protein
MENLKQIEYLHLGSAPVYEDFTKVDDPHFEEKSPKEMAAYKAQLYRMFPESAERGVWFTIKSGYEKFGVAPEVVVMYNENDSISLSYANFIDSNLPDKWDEIAKKELAES